MTNAKKRQTRRNGLLLVSFLLAINVLYAGSALAATSTVHVTTTPFLSLFKVPDAALVSSLTVPIADVELTSDVDGFLSQNRFLVVRDTRGCGGFNLQVAADPFTPATTPELRDTTRIISSTADLVDGVVSNGVKYFSFTGQQGVVAPLDVATNNFSDPALFTGPPFDVVDNILDAPLDLMLGPLTSPDGRTGFMQIDLSYYMFVPKYFPPNLYYTTLTYTLTDDTTGVCP